MKYSFSLIDWIVVAAYFALILYIGFITARKKSAKEGSSKEEFLLAGRRITLPIFVATLVATWYGNILGVGEFVYNNGILAWVCFGLPYYIAAAAFAFYAAKKIRALNVHTIPEQITQSYGKYAGWLSSLIILVITIPAAYVLMLGVIIQMFTGWELWICITAGTVLSMVFLFSGGFKADVLTNSAQFVLMYAGFGALIFFASQKLGSPMTLGARLPEAHLQFFGNASWQYVLAWFIISLQTFVDPSFHQRCAAAKSQKTAQRGILISIACWAVFDSLTLLSGLYAKAYFRISDPVMAFPVVGNAVLPVFWKGIFVVSLLATVMSTLDSYAFISAATIGNDILLPIRRLRKYTGRFTTQALTRFGLAITGLAGIIMAVALPSAVDLIYRTASIAVPPLIVPLLVSYSSKYIISKRNVIILMVLSALISAFWTLGSIAAGKNMDFPLKHIISSVEPMMPGIIISLVLGMFFIRKNIVHSEKSL
jgi:SSS family solute:Na+ symporter